MLHHLPWALDWPKAGQSGLFLHFGWSSCSLGCSWTCSSPSWTAAAHGLAGWSGPPWAQTHPGWTHHWRAPSPLVGPTEPPECLSTRWFLRGIGPAWSKGPQPWFEPPFGSNQGPVWVPFLALARGLGAAEGRVRVAPGPPPWCTHLVGAPGRCGLAQPKAGLSQVLQTWGL